MTFAEPTNMLDMKAIIWLENYLQDWPNTILVVSHDRQFLNSVATDILHLHSMQLQCYRGNYEVFHKTREEKIKNRIKEYEAQKQYRDHIQAGLRFISVIVQHFLFNSTETIGLTLALYLIAQHFVFSAMVMS
jgi:ATPase subunit of ABC transporter with duplicated ATPase domains